MDRINENTIDNTIVPEAIYCGADDVALVPVPVLSNVDTGDNKIFTNIDGDSSNAVQIHPSCCSILHVSESSQRP